MARGVIVTDPGPTSIRNRTSWTKFMATIVTDPGPTSIRNERRDTDKDNTLWSDSGPRSDDRFGGNEWMCVWCSYCYRIPMCKF